MVTNIFLALSVLCALAFVGGLFQPLFQPQQRGSQAFIKRFSFLVGSCQLSLICLLEALARMPGKDNWVALIFFSIGILVPFFATMIYLEVRVNKPPDERK